ncbi:MAG: hypothetical protein EPN82_02345 [Bacteroidetes bacterium]|nr:MAG: hypothetical protein EPN82_02345 [Bacteroidota bacterium]
MKKQLLNLIIILTILPLYLHAGGSGNKDNLPDSTLKIISINTDSANIGDIITISGFGFGSTQDTSFVSFNNIQASEYSSWSETEIKVKVPEGAISGKVAVMVNEKKSNDVDFSVISLIESVLIPAGSFQMGNMGLYYVEYTEIPEHTVTLTKSFYMGKYEITQNQWKKIMGTEPSKFKGDNLPVERINWYEAVEFCNKLSEKDGLTKCYTIIGTDVTCNWNANGWRLPTEAEWERREQQRTFTVEF